MRKKLVLLLMSFSLATPAFAEWRVDIESKTVSTGATGITAEITAFWDVHLAAFALPVIVREIDPGSFWTGTLPYDLGGSAGYHPHAYGVEWTWYAPWANLVESLEPAPERQHPLLLCNPPADSLYDGVSPDQFVIIALGFNSYAAPRPDGRPIVRITFNVSDHPGQFEFDTACYTSNFSTIEMVDYFAVNHGPHGTGEVVFNKGVITLTHDCVCPARGDLNDDGLVGPPDVIALVQYIFQAGAPPPQDPYCPAVNRADWDCNERVNLADLVKMDGYVYRQTGSGPCDPCEKN